MKFGGVSLYGLRRTVGMRPTLRGGRGSGVEAVVIDSTLGGGGVCGPTSRAFGGSLHGYRYFRFTNMSQRSNMA